MAGRTRKSLDVQYMTKHMHLYIAGEVISNRNSNQAKHGERYKKLKTEMRLNEIKR